MSDDAGKTKCPHCGKNYKNLAAHITRVHKDGKSKSSSKSVDQLEKALAKKFLGSDKTEATKPDAAQKEILKESNSKKKKEEKTPKKNFVKKVVVDYWLTDLHSAEIGIYQRERFMAKNRMFSRNLELVGKVAEEGNADGMFGYNSARWDDIPEKDIGKKRLIIKWFNMESVGFLGSIEEMVAESIANSTGSDDTIPSFRIVLPQYKYVVNLMKNHTRLPKIGEVFSFAMMKEDKKANAKKWQIYTFDEKRLTIGSDWEVLLGEDRILAKIDEKKLNIGGKFNVFFYDEEYYKDLNFFRVVILFTMMLKFKKEIFRKIMRIRKALEDEKYVFEISSDEEKMMMNPRALRR
ncbi:MAG: hypothetical protein EU530_05740 [Promethearchaeota archaeon]|nr:MAG: hypothetical protein EU530_05740 [Candidatus Lokiarchaeota archaeon]